MWGYLPQFIYSASVCISLWKLESRFLTGYLYSRLPPTSVYLRRLNYATSPAAAKCKPLSTPAWRLRSSAHCRVEQPCSPFGGPWKAWLSVTAVSRFYWTIRYLRCSSLPASGSSNGLSTSASRLRGVDICQYRFPAQHQVRGLVTGLDSWPVKLKGTAFVKSPWGPVLNPPKLYRNNPPSVPLPTVSGP